MPVQTINFSAIKITITTSEAQQKCSEYFWKFFVNNKSRRFVAEPRSGLHRLQQRHISSQSGIRHTRGTQADELLASNFRIPIFHLLLKPARSRFCFKGKYLSAACPF